MGKSFNNHINIAEKAMESVSKQLMHPSILDGSFRDNAQALVNRWNQAKNNANERMLKLDEKFENAKKLLDDVNMAIDWLSKSRIFDKIRSGKQRFQQEQDKDKKIDILQKQIEELKEMVSESHKKESVIFNLNIAMQNNEAAARDPVYEDKLEHIQSEWKDFNSELNGWKNQIEGGSRKSDEYDNVVSEIETVLTKIKDKRTAGCAQSNEIKELEAELRSLKGRVEVLENLGSELSDIESEIQPNEPSQELVGFQTLKIIKNICEKELNDFERTSMINATDEDKEALAEIQKDKSKIQMERKLSQKPETFESQENFEIHENNNIKESSKINENFQTDQSEKRTTVLKPESVMTENHNENVSRHIKVRHIKTQS